MPVTISQYIEAVANPNGRFRTLTGIYPLLDKYGDPEMKVNDLCADFDVVFGNENYTLKCLLGANTKTSNRLREIATFTRLIFTPYLADCSYLENEILVFDPMGEPRQLDVFLTKVPSGGQLCNFLDTCTNNKDTASIGRLATNVCKMARWMWENELTAGRISLHNINVTTNEIPVITDYTNSQRKRSIEELRGWCTLVAVLCCCSSDPDLYKKFFAEHIAGKSKLIAMSGLLNGVITELENSPLKNLTALINSQSQDETTYPHQLIEMAEKLVACGIVGRKELNAIYSLIAQPSKNKEDNHIINPSAKYLFIGDMSCNKMRAFDGKHWHYIDKNGEVLISGELIDASDFEEGRAVVETDSGFGIIDGDGEFVLKPWFDDLSWDSYNNLIIATMDGRSGIYSRSGEQIADMEYELLLDCSEGLLAARKGNKFGYLRKNGSVAIDFRYEDAFGFRDGLARVKHKGRPILIDTKGQVVDIITDSSSD